MTTDVLARRPGETGMSPWTVVWLAAVTIAVVLTILPTDFVPAWALDVPKAWLVPLARWLSAAMDWLVDEASLGLFTFRELTRAIAWLLEWPLELATSLFATGLMDGEGSAAQQILPPIPWPAVIVLVAWLGWRAGGRGLSLLVGVAFLYLAAFGQWQSAMTTLASILVAVPFGVAGGLLFGIWAVRSRGAERLLTPVLDLMQTVPVFAYLVPILILFGFGPVAALIATIVYALPPMVRVTIVALRQVPAEIVEYGQMAGCTPGQLTWRVMVPAAGTQLMVGVNQVIMLSLNMVIIASMIGAGGLGFDVLSALRSLQIGKGLEAGIAIVVLAIVLDRVNQGFVRRTQARTRASRSVRWGERRVAIAVIAIIALLYLAQFFIPAIAAYPVSWRVSTAAWWDEQVSWLTVNFFDAFEAAKIVVLQVLLLPVKRFMLGMPWVFIAALATLAGWRFGGLRLALMGLAFTLFIAFTGNWENAMETVYLCGVAVIVAAAIGIPLGIASGLSPRLWRMVEAVIDTLQTLPSFVYLIPVVMLFRVGDFTALLAIVLYAVAPAVRYTAHGIRDADPRLIEAGTAAACTRTQILFRIRLPLALPQILLGLNQTIMLALSMLVITALVGTRDLGQEVYVALTKADVGRGIVAGLCVAFIAMIADRLITAATLRTKRRLGLA